MLLNLQLLRAVAAYLVVFVHLYDLLPETSVTDFLRAKGYSGVDLFFVISGFIMVHTTTLKTTTAAQFLLDRLRRITPLYYVMTLFVFCIALAFPAIFSSTSSDVGALLKSLAFIPFEKSPGRIYPVYYLGWTLNYEMFFYLVFSISIAVWYRMRVLICSVVICVLVLLHVFARQPESIIFYFYTQPIMLDFVLGMMLATFRGQIMKAIRGAPLLPWLALAFGIAGLFVASSVFVISQGSFAPPTNTFLTFGIPAALVVMAAVLLEDVRKHKGRGRFFVEIGNASYSIYLSHFFVVAAMVAVADHFNLYPVTRVILAVLALFLIAVVGICLYRSFERPVGSALTRWLSFRSAARRSIPVDRGSA